MRLQDGIEESLLAEDKDGETMGVYPYRGDEDTLIHVEAMKSHEHLSRH